MLLKLMESRCISDSGYRKLKSFPTDSLNLFTFVQHIDGREPRGRQAIAEQLMDIEDRLLVVKTQIQSIRNLYMEV